MAREMTGFQCNLNGEQITADTAWVSWPHGEARPSEPWGGRSRVVCKSCADQLHKSQKEAGGFFTGEPSTEPREDMEKLSTGWPDKAKELRDRDAKVEQESRQQYGSKRWYGDR